MFVFLCIIQFLFYISTVTASETACGKAITISIQPWPDFEATLNEPFNLTCIVLFDPGMISISDIRWQEGRGLQQPALPTHPMTQSDTVAVCTLPFLKVSKCVLNTDIQGRSKTSYIFPCNGVASHGDQIEGLQVFAHHTHINKCKTNASMNFARRQRFTHVYLQTKSAVDAGDIHTWRTMIILITGKSRRPPIWAPCRNKKLPVPLYICGFEFPLVGSIKGYQKDWKIHHSNLVSHKRSFSIITLYLECTTTD